LATEFVLAEAIYLASLEAQSHDPFTCSVGGSGTPWLASIVPDPRLECLDIASAATLRGLQGAYLTGQGDVASISDASLFGASTPCNGDRRVGDGRINAFDLAVLMWNIFQQPPYDASFLEEWTVVPRVGTAARCRSGQTAQQYAIELQEDFCAAGSVAAPTNSARALSEAGTSRALSEPAVEAPRSMATTVTSWNIVPGAGEWTRIRLLDAPDASLSEQTTPAIELFLVGVGGGQTAPLDPEPPPAADCTGAACAPAHDEQKVSIHFSRRQDLILDAGADPAACSAISQAGAHALGPGGVLSLLQSSPARACPFDIFVWVPQTFRDGLSGSQADTCAGAVGVGEGSWLIDGDEGASSFAPVCASSFPPPAAPTPPGSPPLSPPFVLVTTPWVRVDLGLEMPAAGIGQSALNSMRDLLAEVLGVPSSFVGAQWEAGSTLALVVAVPADEAEWTDRGALQVFNVTQLVDAALNSVGGSIEAAQAFMEQAVPSSGVSLSLQPVVTWYVDDSPPSPPPSAPPPPDAAFLTLGVGNNATLAAIIAAAATGGLCCCCCIYCLVFRRKYGKVALRKEHPVVLPGDEPRLAHCAPPLHVGELSSDSLHDRFDSFGSRRPSSRGGASRRDSRCDSSGGPARRRSKEELQIELLRKRLAAVHIGSIAGLDVAMMAGAASQAGRSAPGVTVLAASRDSSANVSVRNSRRLISAEDGSYVTSRESSHSASPRHSRRRISAGDADAHTSIVSSLDASRHDFRRQNSVDDMDHDPNIIHIVRRSSRRNLGAGLANAPPLDRRWSASSVGSVSEAEGSSLPVQPPSRFSLSLSRLGSTDDVGGGPSADPGPRRFPVPLGKLDSKDDVGSGPADARPQPRFLLPLHKLTVSTELIDGSAAPRQQSPRLSGSLSPGLSPVQRVLRCSSRLSRGVSFAASINADDVTVLLNPGRSHRQNASPQRRHSHDAGSRGDGPGNSRVGSPLKGTSPTTRCSFGASAERDWGSRSHHDSYRLSHHDRASHDGSRCGSPRKSAAEVVARSLAAGTTSSASSLRRRQSWSEAVDIAPARGGASARGEGNSLPRYRHSAGAASPVDSAPSIDLVGLDLAVKTPPPPCTMPPRLTRPAGGSRVIVDVADSPTPSPPTEAPPDLGAGRPRKHVCTPAPMLRRRPGGSQVLVDVGSVEVPPPPSKMPYISPGSHVPLDFRDVERPRPPNASPAGTSSGVASPLVAASASPSGGAPLLEPKSSSGVDGSSADKEESITSHSSQRFSGII